MYDLIQLSPKRCAREELYKKSFRMSPLSWYPQRGVLGDKCWPQKDDGVIGDTGASVLQKKEGLKKFFFKRSQKKRSSKIFFRQFPLEENKKRSSQIFCEVSGASQQNFNDSKNSAVLKPRTVQFSRTWGFEAKAKDFKICPRGQGRPRGLHLCLSTSFLLSILVADA